ncbi:EF-hand domain-containing protein [Brevundimonas lenta]|uniref:Ca2+-binding EF-hand superfamily protein n=1 Tax=Brevundimonas lenta TaxID=424796 RepID=A0A7W6JBN2_9CAUL|nr:EF-hand domain-containing protein [Brevundimonas lenta]MBB4082133.1 Ca2+-binding EF-hand superfamily protein [Brevundimonas lenta]
MNRTFLLGGITALALTVAAGAANAQQPDAQQPTRAMRADADGDGRISQAEFVGGRIERLTAADANRDGSVTREELQAVGQARRAQRVEARFDRLDANDDGAISREEFDAPREARADRGPRPARAHRGYAGRGHRGDRMEARGPIVIADVQTRTEQAFARLDADSDGYVTTEERRAGREAMRQQHRERRAAYQAEQASPKAPASE